MFYYYNIFFKESSNRILLAICNIVFRGSRIHSFRFGRQNYSFISTQEVTVERSLKAAEEEKRKKKHEKAVLDLATRKRPLKIHGNI